MKITALCVAALLAACAYEPPVGYTESEVSSCKNDVYLGRAALLPLAVVPIVNALLASSLKKPSEVIDSCLADLHSPNE